MRAHKSAANECVSKVCILSESLNQFYTRERCCN